MTLDELAELARNATPGHWMPNEGAGPRSGFHTVSAVFNENEFREGDICQLFPFSKRSFGIKQTHDNLYYIAACRPAVITALVNAIGAARTAIEVLTAHDAAPQHGCEQCQQVLADFERHDAALTTILKGDPNG